MKKLKFFFKIFIVLLLPVVLFLALAQRQQTSAQTVIGTIPVGSFPRGVAVNPTTNRIYVANELSDTVTVINGSDNTTVATVPVGAHPTAVAVNPNTNRIYVTTNGEVSVIDGGTNSEITRIPVGGSPFDVAVNPNTNRVYVTGSPWVPHVSVIDGATNAVIATILGPVGDLGLVGAAAGVAVNPNTNLIYVGGLFIRRVAVIDGETNTVQVTIPVGFGNNRDLAVNSNINRVYVVHGNDRHVSVIDGGNNSIITTLETGANPAGLGVNPFNNRVYVGNTGDNTVSVIDGTTNTLIINLSVGNVPGHGSIGVNPITNRIYVANAFSDDLSIIEDFGVFFYLSVSPSSISIQRGSSGSTTIELVWRSGLPTSVSLSTKGLPIGATATVLPEATCNENELVLCFRDLIISTQATTPGGTFTVEIIGTAGGFTQITNLTLVIKGPLVKVPVRWCGLSGSPSIVNPSLVGESNTNDVMARRHERANTNIYQEQTDLIFRSGTTTKIPNFPIIPDPVILILAGEREGYVSSSTELLQIINSCRKTWQDKDPSVTGITAVHVDRFFGQLSGAGYGGSYQDFCSNTSLQLHFGRIWVKDTSYNSSSFEPVLVGHELAHGLCLNHGDGINQDGDGKLDEDPPGDEDKNGCPGVCGFDDDGDGQIDEGNVNDDDEDSLVDEDGPAPTDSACLPNLMCYFGGTALTSEQSNKVYDQALLHIPDRIVNPTAPPLGVLRVDTLGEIGEAFVDIDAMTLVTDLDKTTFSLSTFGLFPDNIANLNYFFFSDVDNNPSTGGSPSSIGFPSTAKGIDLIGQVQVNVTNGTALAIPTILKFQNGSFVSVVDPNIQAKVVRDILPLLPEPGQPPPAISAIPLAEIILLEIPNTVIGPLAPEVRTQVVAQNPSTGTVDGADACFDFSGEGKICVQIDIKPGSDPNSINLGKEGVIPVAILATPSFDAATVDPLSITLEGGAVQLKGKSGNAGSLEDVDGDGDLDLIVQITDWTLSEGQTSAILQGKTKDGISIQGKDTIRVIPP